MKVKRLALFLIQELILVLVFLSAAWINVGTNPGEEFLKIYLIYIYNLLPNTFFFWTLPFLIMFFAILASYFISGSTGVIALALIFAGGFFVGNFWGIVLLVFGAFLGIFAPLRE
jgi:hypothetical protein